MNVPLPHLNQGNPVYYYEDSSKVVDGKTNNGGISRIFTEQRKKVILEKEPLVMTRTMVPPLSYFTPSYSKSGTQYGLNNLLKAESTENNEETFESMIDEKYEDPEIIPYEEYVELKAEGKTFEQIKLEKRNQGFFEGTKGKVDSFFNATRIFIKNRVFGDKMVIRDAGILILAMSFLIAAYAITVYIKDYISKKRSEQALINALGKSNT